MSVQQPERTIRPSAEAAGGTISCAICEAVYAPARSYEQLALASSIALESAFMSMCHFCFRCRRPACPGCWDDVHGICGACGRETDLPFRAATTPLGAVLFTNSRQAQMERERTPPAPLLCVQPGTFSTIPHPSVEQASQTEEQLARRPAGQPKATVVIPERRQVEQPKAAVIVPGKRPVTPQAREPVSRIESEDLRTLPERGKRFIGAAERLLTVLLSLLLFIVLVMIVAATLSENANMLIASTLHVDIRAEIAYLWQLITHIR